MKTIRASERDQRAAGDALDALQDSTAPAHELRARLWQLRKLLQRTAPPRVSKPLRPH